MAGMRQRNPEIFSLFYFKFSTFLMSKASLKNKLLFCPFFEDSETLTVSPAEDKAVPPKKKECPGCGTKLYQAQVLEIWDEWSSPSMPLLPGQHWLGMVVPVRVQSRDKIELFENYLYLIGILDIILA